MRSEPAAARRWIEQTREDGATVLYLQGVWRLTNLHAVAAEVGALRLSPQQPCILDGSRLETLDTATVFVLLRRLVAAGCTRAMVSMRAVQERHARLLALVHERMAAPDAAATRTRHAGVLHRLGAATLRGAGHLQDHTRFLGIVAAECLAALRTPATFRLQATVAQFETVALDAIPIVAMMTCLVGVVFAYLLGAQARRYGATIFVVDGVGLALCRELAPMLVAVIVAGRSGAAFTAQLGSMKVQEETDAIRTLGLSPVQVLVIPRLVAIVIGLPLLVLLGDIAGIAGGMLISAWQLDIPPAAFAHRLHAALPRSALVIGLAKAPVFAAFIALIGCRMGLSVTRDSRSVGEHTTSTVVQAIVWVIALDAVFAVTLQHLGI
ncbi:ABC transporter permease [Piscinibacter sp. XHJ-5]|uniref:MlaE family ABC transporter permease n=1 Tax=Piscinibacter sp. XHJ-5 TaxID=3037797 RepID=UPI002453655E|nr:ABC transporter permease [Piscinibacter sp. XHJ-5]